MYLTIILASSLIATPSSMYMCIHEVTHIHTNTYTRVYKRKMQDKRKQEEVRGVLLAQATGK